MQEQAKIGQQENKDQLTGQSKQQQPSNQKKTLEQRQQERRQQEESRQLPAEDQQQGDQKKPDLEKETEGFLESILQCAKDDLLKIGQADAEMLSTLKDIANSTDRIATAIEAMKK